MTDTTQTQVTGPVDDAMSTIDLLNEFAAGVLDCDRDMNHHIAPLEPALARRSAAYLELLRRLAPRADAPFEREQVDAAYTERNRLVAALTKFLPSCLVPASDAEPGWSRVVMIDGPTGQMSWHIPDHEVESQFPDLGIVHKEWDGHTTEQKYERLALLPRAPMPDVVTIPDAIKAVSEAIDNLYGQEACFERYQAETANGMSQFERELHGSSMHRLPDAEEIIDAATKALAALDATNDR